MARCLPTMGAGAWLVVPSGLMTLRPSIRSGMWSTSNRPSETAPSIVTQVSRSDSIRVWVGTIHGRWAWAEKAAPARASTMTIFFMGVSLLNGDRHGTNLFLAGEGGGLLALGRPGEGHAHQFAAAGFARGFDDQLVVAGR